jgi:hypothetical protein
LFDDTKLVATIDRFAVETRTDGGRREGQTVPSQGPWDHRTEERLIVEAATLPEIAGLLDPFVATQLQKTD